MRGSRAGREVMETGGGRRVEVDVDRDDVGWLGRLYGCECVRSASRMIG